MGEPNLTDLVQVARLIHERNEIDAQVNAIVRRSPVHGHLGEYIAAAIFDINLNRSASHAGHDGSFASGVLEGKTVNIKWYGRREGILDMKEENAPDFYLVMTGPRGPGVRGGLRPLVIDAVYLFETTALFDEQRRRDAKIGVAASVPKHLWDAAEIYPENRTVHRILSDEGEKALRFFASPKLEED